MEKLIATHLAPLSSFRINFKFICTGWMSPGDKYWNKYQLSEATDAAIDLIKLFFGGNAGFILLD
jgi:hypothetical protein